MRTWYAVISLAFIILSILLYEIHPLITKEFEEDRIVENISAAIFFIIFLMSLTFLIAHKHIKYRNALILIMFLGLIGFLDEISFGQRIFDFNVPIILGFPLDAVHDFYAIAIIAVKEYVYISIAIFLLIAIVAVYALINRKISLSGVTTSIILETPYSFLAFFAV
jgi:hypothetical protein